jgi:hypothetical protein
MGKGQKIKFMGQMFYISPIAHDPWPVFEEGK